MQIKAIYISPGHDCVGRHGKARLEHGIQKLDPVAFRRNVLTVGIDLNTLIGQHFSLQDVEFEGSEECRPCYWMDQAAATGVYEALKGFGGLRARIMTSGNLSVD